MSEKQLHLVRGLGAWSSAAIVVGTMIGTGIFLKPSEMAREGGTVAVVYAAWIVGGILSLFGALAYSELGTAIPEAGGEYAYLRRAFGPVWGFLFGWMHSIVGRPASIASISAGLILFLSFLVPAVGKTIFVAHLAIPGMTHWLPGYEFRFTWAQPLAVCWVFAITGVNYLGVRLGGAVQVLLTAIKLISVLMVIGAALFAPSGAPHSDSLVWPAIFDAHLFRAFFAALAAALWAYDGWEDLNLVGAEVENPEKNFPRALIGGVLFSTAVFLLFTSSCLNVLSFQGVAVSRHVASDVVASVAGHGVAAWLTVALVIAALGTLNSSILSGARVPYAMARDGIFFCVAQGIHPKYRTPARALLFQCAVATVMALTGTFEELTSLFVFAGWIFYGLAVVALFRLRHTEPAMPRPFRCPGYPWLPGIFVAGALAITANIWAQRPGRSTIGLLLILAGLPFYRWWTTRTTPQN